MAEPRGISLEREFSVWMKKNLEYHETKLRQPVKGKIADRAYEVDVYARRESILWLRTKYLGYFICGVAVFTYLLPTELQEVRAFMEQLVGQLSPSLVGSAVFVFGIVAFIVGYIGSQRATVHAWVECKDTKQNVKRAQVQKLIAAISDVKESEEAKWKPDIVYLVSGSDFDADALNFAREQQIICYRRSADAGFERVH